MVGEKGKAVVSMMDGLREVIGITALGLGYHFAILIGKYGKEVIKLLSTYSLVATWNYY